ncbi:MAG: hypothetical protein LBL21_01380 [Rickettsiales bacterium]|jgi:hypothetical protein|nr:hypothetical protein [Rickettsiales bacterium]
MKFTKSIISAFLFASVVCGAHAIKLCQLDWLESWKTASGVLSNSRYSCSAGNYDDSTGHGGIGIWSVTSDQGSAGVYHTVSGQSFCSDNINGVYTSSTPSFNGISAYNMHCWCRMTAPNLGASWVYSNAHPRAAICVTNCADICANCVLSSAGSSCSRSAVLALP